MSDEGLRLDESVHLGYAVLARLASDHGVRLLGIKGPLLASQGLREPRSSVDIDVLVEPAGYDRLREALTGVGWAAGEDYPFTTVIPMHSVTHRHPAWPCEVDVHHWFPGFLADPQDVFDVLWERRTTVAIARQDIPAPDPVSHAAIAALHYLRNPDTGWGKRTLDDLVATVTLLWGPSERGRLASLAAETAASDTLRPLLDRIGVVALPALREEVVPLSDWELRMYAEQHEVVRWLVGLARTPWLARPGFVFDAIWRGNNELRYADPSVPGARRALTLARLRRLRRGGRALPAAATGLWRLNRQRDRATRCKP